MLYYIYFMMQLVLSLVGSITDQETPSWWVNTLTVLI